MPGVLVALCSPKPASLIIAWQPLQAWALWRHAESSAAVRALVRTMICLFFANEVLDAYQKWQHMQTPEMKLRRATYPHRAIYTRCAPPCYQYWRLAVGSQCLPCLRWAMPLGQA